MRLILASCLILGGALLGGVFPGAALAFHVAAGSGLSGSAGEVVCFAANLVFGVGGAVCGGLVAQSSQQGTRWRYSILFAVIIGLAAGTAGYLWCDWALSHAEPPL
jgi:hypothetical protein